MVLFLLWFSLLGCAPRCGKTTPILTEDGQPTGLVRCASGAINRDGPQESRTEIEGESCSARPGRCSVDANCGRTAIGRCLYDPSGCYCANACGSDADCPSGKVCAHPIVSELAPGWGGAPYGVCRRSNCASGDDCPSGQCGLTPGDDCDEPGFFCRSPGDECDSKSDCPDEGRCRFDGEHFVCSFGFCIVD